MTYHSNAALCVALQVKMVLLYYTVYFMLHYNKILTITKLQQLDNFTPFLSLFTPVPIHPILWYSFPMSTWYIPKIGVLGDHLL